LHKPRSVEQQQDLGVLFLGFLRLYGQEFNYFRTGLSIRDGGYYFPKAQRNWVDWQQPWLLSAEVSTPSSMCRNTRYLATCLWTWRSP
jgi:non-canonical poly(A) RNA polymerase PAPD5/7